MNRPTAVESWIDCANRTLGLPREIQAKRRMRIGRAGTPQCDKLKGETASGTRYAALCRA